MQVSPVPCAAMVFTPPAADLTEDEDGRDLRRTSDDGCSD